MLLTISSATVHCARSTDAAPDHVPVGRLQSPTDRSEQIPNDDDDKAAHGRHLLGLPCQTLGTCTYTVFGNVVNGAGSTVEITGNGVSKTASVSATGGYVIENVPNGEFSIQPRAQQGCTFLPRSVSVRVANAEATAPSMTRLNTISGNIVNGAGATVVIVGPNNLTSTAIADANGNYLFGDLPSGEYIVEPQHDSFNYVPGVVRVVIANAGATAETMTRSPQAALDNQLTGGSATQSTAQFNPFLDTSTSFRPFVPPKSYPRAVRNRNSVDSGSGFSFPGGPDVNGLYPESGIPPQYIGSYDYDPLSQRPDLYYDKVPINVGNENRNYPWLPLTDRCNLPGYRDLYRPNPGVRSAFQLTTSLGCTANLLAVQPPFTGWSLRSSDAPRNGTRFFSTAAHCFENQGPNIVGGMYTSRSWTMCSQVNITNCGNQNSWAVARLTAGPRTGNAAVFLRPKALAEAQKPGWGYIPEEDDYAIFAAYPISATDPSNGILCQAGRNYRAFQWNTFEKHDCCANFNKPSQEDGECICAKTDRNAFSCFKECNKCDKHDCRSKCTRVRTSSLYFVGYPGFSPEDENCGVFDGTIQIRSDVFESAASIQACNAASKTNSLQLKAYNCGGMSGGGLSVVGSTEIFGTLATGSSLCTEDPNHGTFSLIRPERVTYFASGGGVDISVSALATNYDADIQSLCNAAGGCDQRC